MYITKCAGLYPTLPPLSLFCEDDFEHVSKSNFLPCFPAGKLNYFCLFCLHYVDVFCQSSAYRELETTSRPLFYTSRKYNCSYLAHAKCLERIPSHSLFTLIGAVNKCIIRPINVLPDIQEQIIGKKEYYVEVTMSHPVSSKVIAKIRNKITCNKGSIYWKLSEGEVKENDRRNNVNNISENERCNNKESNLIQSPIECFTANAICFPAQDFELSVETTEMCASENKNTIKVYVDVLDYPSSERIIAISEELALSLKIHHEKQSKESAIHRMNFKYPHSLDLQLPLLELMCLRVVLEEEDPLTNGNSFNVEELLKESFKEEETAKTEKNMYNNKKNNISHVGNTLESLITCENFIELIKTSNQSRQLQQYLLQANNKELEKIIRLIENDLCELIQNEYANYMLQRLFSVCDQKQRYTLLTHLAPNIPIIVRNKHGTHTMQAIIEMLTTEEEHRIISSCIQSSKANTSNVLKKEFELSIIELLAKDSNGTHFLQKIVGLLPWKYLRLHCNEIKNRICEFALHKNAMCVLKCVLKRLCVEELGSELKEENEEIKACRKIFISIIAREIKTIIQDSYGNYVIQFCFEFFGREECKELSRIIINHLGEYAIQRFAANVVMKCIKEYWQENWWKSVSEEQIFLMNKHREGGRVLEIIDKFKKAKKYIMK